MHLQKTTIQGFGKLIDLSFEFHPRINLFFGPNEAGKSTLQQAILYLLFGFHQSSRATKQENLLRDRFKPWQGAAYGGQLWYELQDSRSFQVDRNFDGENMSTSLFDVLTGEEITTQFAAARHGKIDFQDQHLGMERDLFEATAFVRQAEVRSIAGDEHLMNGVVGILDSGPKDTSAADAVKRLQKRIQDIGSDRATKKELPKLRQQRRSLQEEYEHQLQVRAELKDKILEKRKLEELVGLENLKEIELKYMILTRSIDNTEKQLSELGKYRREVDRVDRAIREMGQAEAFQDELREPIMRRRQNRASYEEQLNEKNQAIEELDDQIAKIEEKIRPLERFEQIRESMPYPDYKALSRQWLEKNEEVKAAQSILDGEEVDLLRQGVDLNSLKELQNLQPAELSTMNELVQQQSQLEADIERLEYGFQKIEMQTWAKRWIRNAMLISTPAASLAVFLISYFVQFSPGFPIAAGLLGLGGIIYQFYRRARKKIAKQSAELESELNEIHQKSESASRELHGHFKKYNVSSLNELVTRQMQFKKYLDLVASRDRALTGRERLDFQLLKYLQLIGIREIKPEDLEQITRDYSRFYEIHMDLQIRLQTRHRLQKELNSLIGRIADNDSALAELLSQADLDGTHLPEAEEEFDKRYEEKKRLNSLKRENEKFQSAVDGILATKTEDEIREELSELLGRREKLASFPDIGDKSSRRTLPSLQEEFEVLNNGRQEHERELSALETEIETILEQHRPQAEVEEELAQVEAEASRLEEFRSSLELASDILQQVANQYHRSVVPELNESLSKGMKSVTSGKYEQVHINPTDFSINLLLPETGTLGSADILSLGTQDQLYLLLRVGLSRLVSENGEPIPLILDDPFVHFDQARLANMLSFLKKFSRENQVLLFTKEPFILAWCEQNLSDSDYNLFGLSEMIMPGQQ